MLNLGISRAMGNDLGKEVREKLSKTLQPQVFKNMEECKLPGDYYF